MAYFWHNQILTSCLKGEDSEAWKIHEQKGHYQEALKFCRYGIQKSYVSMQIAFKLF